MDITNKGIATIPMTKECKPEMDESSELDTEDTQVCEEQMGMLG